MWTGDGSLLVPGRQHLLQGRADVGPYVGKARLDLADERGAVAGRQERGRVAEIEEARHRGVAR